MNTYTAHITRDGPLGPDIICGADSPSMPWLVYTYYNSWHRGDTRYWCPECVEALTPLDELAHTKL